MTIMMMMNRGAVAIAVLCPALLMNASVKAQQYVLYVFDQSPDKIVRLIDLNGDGDYHDAGEATRFYDDSPGPVLGINNAQGMVTLGVDRLLATDNFAPDNIVLIEDLNSNGNGLDPGEASEAFNGMLPDGFLLTNPADLHRQNASIGSGLLLLDNNTLDDTNPEAIYTLNDLNGDGDYNDAGEVVRNFILSPVGDSFGSTFLGIIQDNTGFIYGIDIAEPSSDPSNLRSIDRIDLVNGTRNEWINNNATFVNLNRFINGSNELAHNPITDEILVELVDNSFNGYLYAMRDVNGSGVIDGFNEVRLLWSELGNADGVMGGTMNDFTVMSDGSVFALDNLSNRVRHFVDLNEDGDFQDLGESRIVYDSAVAAVNGAETLNLLLSLAVAEIPACTGDIADDFGTLGSDDQVSFGDFLALLGLIGPCPGGTVGCTGDIADDFGTLGGGDGQVSFGDFLALLGLIGACP